MTSGRRVLAALLLAAAGGCGSGSGGMPAGPGPAPPSVGLADGRYAFTVYSTGIGCVLSAVGHPAGPAPTSITAPVDVSAAGAGWQIAVAAPEYGTMTGTLSRSGAGVSGSVAGPLIQSGAGVVLDHRIDGTVRSAGEGLEGTVTGTVNYVAQTGTAMCTTNAWSLEPR
jgi:hypothetical protein